ncbi:MAG: peptidoglycan DD-metalloendopeptidase family protein [Candidatus Gottesmanbacteria bacterium]
MKKKFSELTIVFTLLVSFVLFGAINCFAYSGMVKPVDVKDYDSDAVYNPKTRKYLGVPGTGTWDYSTMHRDNEDKGAISGCNGEGCGSHPGVDIPTTSDTEVMAIADGVVSTSKNIVDSKTGVTASWGGLIIIKHNDVPNVSEPVWSIYAHLKVRYVNKDAVIKKGQLIGLSGGDKNDPHHGNSSAAHLHFQIDRDTRADTGEGFLSPYWPENKKPYYRTVDKADVNPAIVDNYCYNPILFIQAHQQPDSTDKTPPIARCKNITVQLDASGKAAITVADVNNGSSDNRGIMKMSVSSLNFTCANIGSNKVTLTVTDTSGNKSTCTSTVTVKDAIAPNAKCKNITVQLNSKGKAAITAANVNNGSSDNCGIASMNVAPSSFTSADIGSKKVTLTVADKSGNKSTCTANVTVKAYKK